MRMSYRSIILISPSIAILAIETNGSGTEFVIVAQGGNDDWGNPRKLDITRFGVASNLTDSFYILMAMIGAT